MQQRSSAEIISSPANDAAADGSRLAPLWQSPCWFSSRLNFLAFHFNNPVYDWIQTRYGLVRPEFVSIYTTGLMPGLTAHKIAAASGFPKNTLSRAINNLVERGLLRRTQHPDDQRSYVLHLTPPGRRIFDDAMPLMLARQATMLSALTPSEQEQLAGLMSRMIQQSETWPTELSE